MFYKFLKYTLFAVILGASQGAFANDACPLRSDISNDQARELKATIVSEDSDDLDIIEAYETLSCAKRETLQRLAIDAALSSSSRTLKTIIVEDLLFGKDVVTIELEGAEGLNPKAVALIIQEPNCSLKTTRVNSENKVMQFDSNSSNLISYDSLVVDIKTLCGKGYSLNGRLTFENESFSGNLHMGQPRNGKGLGFGLVPAKIVIFKR